MVDQLHVRRIVEISEAQHTLALADPFFGKGCRAMLFIQRVVDFLNQFRNDFVDTIVLVGRFLRRTGNDQRRPRLVN